MPLNPEDIAGMIGDDPNVVGPVDSDVDEAIERVIEQARTGSMTTHDLARWLLSREAAMLDQEDRSSQWTSLLGGEMQVGISWV